VEARVFADHWQKHRDIGAHLPSEETQVVVVKESSGICLCLIGEAYGWQHRGIKGLWFIVGQDVYGYEAERKGSIKTTRVLNRNMVSGKRDHKGLAQFFSPAAPTLVARALLCYGDVELEEWIYEQIEEEDYPDRTTREREVLRWAARYAPTWHKDKGG
jgi:hypothetical protein